MKNFEFMLSKARTLEEAVSVLKAGIQEHFAGTEFEVKLLVAMPEIVTTLEHPNGTMFVNVLAYMEGKTELAATPNTTKDNGAAKIVTM